LCAKGCVSDAELLFAGTYVSGKKKDLSVFGTDFNDFINVKIESADGSEDFSERCLNLRNRSKEAC
jgi:hypothetical protein